MKNKKFSTIAFTVVALRKGSTERLGVASLQHGSVDVLVERRKLDDELKEELMRLIKTTVDKLQRDLSR
jgi:hypothetical protein